MPWMYLLECADGSFYAGSTWDLDRRLGEHAQGLGSKYTRHRLPVKLVFATEFERIEEAYAFREAGAGLEPSQAHRLDREPLG